MSTGWIKKKMGSPTTLLPNSHVDILVETRTSGCCMDLCSWGGCWDVWTTIPIRNEGPSVIRVLPTILNSQTPSEISLTEDSCLARGLPSSWVATSNDYCKNPAFLSQFPFSWTLSENQLDFCWYCIAAQCLPGLALLFTLLYPRCWSLPNRHFYILASIIFILTMHKIPVQRCPSPKPTTFLDTFGFCPQVFPLK